MFVEVEGVLLLVVLLSANLLIGGLTTRFVRVGAAGLEERGVDELDGFPQSVRPARVPALPDVDAALGFAFLLGTLRPSRDPLGYHFPWIQLAANELWNFQG